MFTIEGELDSPRSIDPSELARNWATQFGKDPRLIELVLRESRRIVRMDRDVLIAETRHGFVTANAGIDQSNVPGEHFATTLPVDPDASAQRIRVALGCGAVIISDTFGRPWREGLVNVAIGISGLDFGSCALHTSIGGIRVLYSVDERRRELLVHAVSEPMARAG